MDFGLQIAGLSTRSTIQAAQTAEEQGFSAVYVPDHFANEPPGSGRLDENVPMWEAITILGAIGQATSKVRIGGHVLCNLFRHPASTASAIATLDHITDGRAVLGLGAGWTKMEFDMTGIPFPDIKPRLRQLDEALTVIKSLWGDGKTRFDGEFYTLSDAFVPHKPVQKPGPQVMLGGSGKGLLRIAARHADMVNVIVDTGKAGTVLTSEVAKLTEEAFKGKLDFVKEEASKAGREIALSSTAFMLMMTGSPEETEQLAAGVGAGFGVDGATVRRMPIALAGTPDEMVEELERRKAEWGIEHFIVNTGAGADVLARFASEVMPRV